jgi:hypothetical protein
MIPRPHLGGSSAANVFLEQIMDTILIVVVLLVLFGGGGYWGYSRWR